jgi:hypothetical protein
MAIPDAKVIALRTVSPTTFMADLVTEDHVGDLIGAVGEYLIRHSVYYLEDGNMQLQAGNTVFEIHSYLFSQESEEARTNAERARTTVDGSVKVDGATADDLKRFCDLRCYRFVLNRIRCRRPLMFPSDSLFPSLCCRPRTIGCPSFTFPTTGTSLRCMSSRLISSTHSLRPWTASFSATRTA